MCELNVIRQLANASQQGVVQNARHRGLSPTMLGFIYGIRDGHLNDLDVTVKAPEQIPAHYRLGSP